MKQIVPVLICLLTAFPICAQTINSLIVRSHFEGLRFPIPLLPQDPPVSVPKIPTPKKETDDKVVYPDWWDATLEGQIIKEWKSLVAELAPKPNADYIQLPQRQNFFIIGEPLRKTAWADYNCFRDQAVFCRKRLIRLGLELEQRGLPQAEMAHMIAWKIFPFVMHEIDHPLIMEAMQAKCGFKSSEPCVDEELALFAKMPAYILNARAKNKQKWDQYKISIDLQYLHILKAAQGGRDSLKKYVTDLYSDLSTLDKLDVQKSIHEIKECISLAHQELAVVQKLQQKRDSASTEQERRQIDMQLSRMRSQKLLEKIIAQYEEDIAILSNPAKLKEMEKFYEEYLTSVLTAKPKK